MFTAVISLATGSIFSISAISVPFEYVKRVMWKTPLKAMCFVRFLILATSVQNNCYL